MGRGCAEKSRISSSLFPVRQMRKTLTHTAQGFTLIELMITVAILGILASLAISAVLHYQSKARWTEATLNLGAMAKMAEAYYTENDTYVSGFNGLGWGPSGTTRYRYWYNQTAASGTPSNPEAGVDYAAGWNTAAVATSTTFLAAAVGNIDNDKSSDQWTMNQVLALVHVQSDVVTP
jgi:prepilin-type N-terminal cleavage/methylation domain-containing protein